jgi:hypothetical protein
MLSFVVPGPARVSVEKSPVLISSQDPAGSVAEAALGVEPEQLRGDARTATTKGTAVSFQRDKGIRDLRAQNGPMLPAARAPAKAR